MTDPLESLAPSDSRRDGGEVTVCPRVGWRIWADLAPTGALGAPTWKSSAFTPLVDTAAATVRVPPCQCGNYWHSLNDDHVFPHGIYYWSELVPAAIGMVHGRRGPGSRQGTDSAPT